jgi:hypothetical protein
MLYLVCLNQLLQSVSLWAGSAVTMVGSTIVLDSCSICLAASVLSLYIGMAKTETAWIIDIKRRSFRSNDIIIDRYELFC